MSLGPSKSTPACPFHHYKSPSHRYPCSTTPNWQDLKQIVPPFWSIVQQMWDHVSHNLQKSSTNSAKNIKHRNENMNRNNTSSMIPEPTIVDFGLAGLPKGLQFFCKMCWGEGAAEGDGRQHPCFLCDFVLNAWSVASAVRPQKY